MKTQMLRDMTGKIGGACLASMFLLASQALAQDQLPESVLGTTSAKGLDSALLKTLKAPNKDALTVLIRASHSFINAQYATAGVALRNRRSGTIEISGVVAPVKRAYLYWAYLFNVAPPAGQGVFLCKPGTSAPCVSFGGFRVATGADPCWGSSGIAIYRADVTAFVTANGEYRVVLPSTASATNSGADPWSGSTVFPAAEGASLVVVGTGTGNVAIFDAGVAGGTFSGTTSYTLSIPNGGVQTTPVLWDNIGADGQVGSSRAAGLANEQTFINNVQIGGPGAPSNAVTDSDWDGSSGWPLPQLWDDTGHSLPTSAAPVGATALNVRFVSQGDCLTPVANVIAY